MLKERALKATLWSALDVFLRQGLRFIFTIVLARLIAPDQFGIVALLSLFTGLAGAFVDSGFGPALIQRQHTSRTDESTVFWFNVATGALATLALVAAAPLIATVFAQPVLVPLTRLIALSIFIGSLGSIHFVLLEKQLDFRTQLQVGAIATAVSGSVAVVLAFRGFGVWALAWQQVIVAACTSALLWALHPWRPAAVFSRTSARSLFGFGGYVLATNLIDTAFSRAYTVLVGKFFGVRELGFYNRADSTQQLPGGTLMIVLIRVAFPVFSVANADKGQLHRGVRLSVRGVTLINAPAMLGLAAVAAPLIATVFGARWLPAAPILQVLCLAGVLTPLHRINLTVLVAQGHSHLFFNLEVLKKALGIALLAGGAVLGVMGVAWAMVVFNVAAFFINGWYTGRYLGYGAAAQTRDIAPIIAVSAAMALTVHGVSTIWHPGTAIALATGVAVGVAFMAVAVPLLRLAAFQDALALLHHRKHSASTGR